MTFKLFLLCTLLFQSKLYAFNTAPKIIDENSAPLEEDEETRNAHILYFLGESENQFVSISLSTRRIIHSGTLLHVYRYYGNDSSGAKIPVGSLQVESIGEKHAVARVTKNITPLSTSAFPEHPGIMAGDFVEPFKYTVRKVKQALPERALNYFQIFKNPNAQPRSYELSQAGKLEIKKAVDIFRDRLISSLFITAYTDKSGPSKQNQIESYQRAQTVRQYLINDLGFAEERVIAIGMGEYSLVDNSQVSGHKLHNRRIMIKATNDSF